MARFSVELQWKMTAYVEVEAPSSAAARRAAVDGDIPEDGEYVEESLKALDAEKCE